MAGYVPTASLNALYANTTPGTVADPAAIDNAVIDIVNTINGNYDFATGLISAGTLSRLGIINVMDYNASGSAQTTTGSITAGSKALTVASAIDFAVGQGISISGAGAAGATLVTTVSAISGLTVTLATVASTTVSGVTVEHDDTVAINAALSAANSGGGGKVAMPPGKYKISSKLEMKYDGTHFVGSGYGESPQYCTEILKNFNGNMIEVKDPDGGQTLRWSISNMNINGNNKTGDGIYAYNAHYGYIENVYVYNNSGGKGVRFELSYSNELQNIISTGNDVNFKFENQSHDITGFRLYSSTATNEGFYVTGSNALSFFGAVHEGAATYGLRIDRNVKGCVFDGFYGESDGNELVNQMVFIAEATTASLACRNIAIKNGHIRINNLYKIPILLRSHIQGARIENVNIEFNTVTIDSNSRGVLVGFSAGVGELKGVIVENIHVDLVNCSGTGIQPVGKSSACKYMWVSGITSNDTTALNPIAAEDTVRSVLTGGNYDGKVTHRNFEVNTSEPNTSTTTFGTLAYADGVTWNPASKSAGFHYRGPAGTWLRLVEHLSGTTASRPTSENYAGRPYFDTTLGKPIWRNAANGGWVDAAGTVV